MLEGSIAHLFTLKVTLDDLRSFLSAMKKAADIAHHFGLIVRSFTAHGVRFDVLVQHLVGIEFRAVPGQIKQADLLVLLQPLLRYPGTMRRMPVHDEKKRGTHLFDKALERPERPGSRNPAGRP